MSSPLTLSNKSQYQIGSRFNAVAVTKSDSADLSPIPSGIYIGGNGDLKVTLLGMTDGTFVIFKGLTAGTFLPVVAKRIWSASTTADMLALY